MAGAGDLPRVPQVVRARVARSNAEGQGEIGPEEAEEA